jgi:hypothetical protein
MKYAMVLAALVALAAACATDGGAPSVGGKSGAGSPSFPAGEAVRVAANYEAPQGRVDSTGPYLPVNGKPTVVWVDAIW